jgi:hypothetical protein
MVPLAEQETLIPIPPGEPEEPVPEQVEEGAPQHLKTELASVVPGTVHTLRCLIVPPRTEKTFHAALNGLPRCEPLKRDCLSRKIKVSKTQKQIL